VINRQLLACSTRSAADARGRPKRIVACAEGGDDFVVAERAVFFERRSAIGDVASSQKGMDGLLDEPRPGAAQISDSDVERVIVRTLETKPARRRHMRHTVDRDRARHESIRRRTAGPRKQRGRPIMK